MTELPPKIEADEQPPILEAVEQELAEMNQEIGEFFGELNTAEKNTDDEKLREQVKELRNEAKWTVDWWAGNILAFTNLVVGDGINFPAMEKTKESKKEETFEEMKDRARKELAENGITSEQMRAYRPVTNDILRRTIAPFGSPLDERIILAIPNLIFGEENWGFTGETYYNRRDAWRLYLGLPQVDGTFAISNFKENESEGYCYKIKIFWKLYLHQAEHRRNENLSDLIKEVESSNGLLITNDYYTGVMGGFNFRLGNDEKGSYIAYSDVWDLDVFPENEKGFFGKPFHIYDRLYYDPETYEPIFDGDTK